MTVDLELASKIKRPAGERCSPSSRAECSPTTNRAGQRTAAGFEEVGIQRRHGKLDGHWKDCVLIEHLLGPAAA
jgi:hypothetical protein